MAKSEKIQLKESLKLYERACKVMPGGVNASARPNQAVGHPLFMERGEGAYLYDVDGNKHIDYCISHGASLLGHGNREVIAAVEKMMKKGGMLSSETEVQVRVAEKLTALFPGTEMVRYTCSGTESTWHALRVARAFTGKWGVIKFEGHYHGVNDTAGYSHWPELEKAGPADEPRAVPDSAGIPPANNALITILPFNDVAALERCLKAKGDDIAALIMEPVNYDSCGLRPTPEFLKAVRDLTAQHGVVLIFDEVLSGFRVRGGGALGSQVTPDMTVLGKAVGGGMPISTFMGTKEIMETCSPTGPALHSGTYNAPPVLVSAMGAFLDQVSKPGFYDHLNTMGERLYGGMREIFERHGLKAWVQGVGCRFGILFGLDSEPRNYRDVSRQDMEMLGRFLLACLNRGVYLHHVSPHHGYSSAHTMADIEETLDVMDQAAANIASA